MRSDRRSKPAPRCFSLTKHSIEGTCAGSRRRRIEGTFEEAIAVQRLGITELHLLELWAPLWHGDNPRGRRQAPEHDDRQGDEADDVSDQEQRDERER